MKLEKCSACQGFVPTASNECPHCSTKRMSRLGAVAAVIGASAISVTLMACYGAPPPNTPNGPAVDTSATPNAPPAPNLDGGK